MTAWLRDSAIHSCVMHQFEKKKQGLSKCMSSSLLNKVHRLHCMSWLQVHEYSLINLLLYSGFSCHSLHCLNSSNVGSLCHHVFLALQGCGTFVSLYPRMEPAVRRYGTTGVSCPLLMYSNRGLPLLLACMNSGELRKTHRSFSMRFRMRFSCF